jgi:hypothetical protein
MLRSQKNLAGLGLAISITLHLDSCIGGCPLRFSQWRNYILLLLLSLRASIPWYTRFLIYHGTQDSVLSVADIVNYFNKELCASQYSSTRSTHTYADTRQTCVMCMHEEKRDNITLSFYLLSMSIWKWKVG